MKKQKIYDVAIIGGGAAGMIAAAKASESAQTILLERNREIGKKVKLTGGGRCNITTSESIETIIDSFGEKGKFLYGALTRFTPQMTMNFFEKGGIKLKEERGKRIFPKNDDANEVVYFFKTKLSANNVDVFYGYRAKSIIKDENVFEIEDNGERKVYSKTVIIATGGKTYPSTGSTGDGYKLAKILGHTITPRKPALVPLIVEAEEILSLVGLDLKNIEMKFINKETNEPFWNGFGEMIFTHKGISGPLVLEASKKVGEQIRSRVEVKCSIDLKPALTDEKLRRRINRDIEDNPKMEYKTLLKGLLPMSMIEVISQRTNIELDKQVSFITREERRRIVDLFKNFDFDIDGIEPVEAGIITAGGVELDEIDSTSMESKIVPGLYFAGEIIDLDGPTGGFNLQLAWSTGYVAGMYAAELE